ncbi:MAG: indolepyruvate oxidoreductase subunit beta [Eubacteriaceae bacterium]|nr:indolepyruvate oxidoreductase subunit beta [Eubacteriaceae bacterium]MCR4894808.1 indolepyruvate oxidoreductase subunit beta [Eubacteriales bacterium]
MKDINIMIVGVGGQGTLLASRLIGNVGEKAGYQVKLSEVHGMSQRGGSVVTYVKLGEKVYSPVITKGEADFIISFEKLEGARYISCLKKDGTLIVNTQEMKPMPVITGAAEYPSDVLEELKKKGVRVDSIDALSLAEQTGLSKSVNIVLMGRLSNYFEDIPLESWLTALGEVVAERFLEANKKAFMLGREVR